MDRCSINLALGLVESNAPAWKLFKRCSEMKVLFLLRGCEIRTLPIIHIVPRKLPSTSDIRCWDVRNLHNPYWAIGFGHYRHSSALVSRLAHFANHALILHVSIYCKRVLSFGVVLVLALSKLRNSIVCQINLVRSSFKLAKTWENCWKKFFKHRQISAQNLL